MKPRSGSASLGPDKLIHLVEAGEVVPRLGRGFADRLHRAAQAGENFGGGKQAVSFTLHGFILPCSSGKPSGELTYDRTLTKTVTGWSANSAPYLLRQPSLSLPE